MVVNNHDREIPTLHNGKFIFVAGGDPVTIHEVLGHNSTVFEGGTSVSLMNFDHTKQMEAVYKTSTANGCANIASCSVAKQV